LFASRPADPALPRLQRLHAARVARVPELVRHADAVAEKVTNDLRPLDAIRDGALRAERRLAGR
jgi:hypothetical protein